MDFRYTNIWRIRLNNLCLIILIFFMVFDTARNYTVLPRAFGFLKDVIIYFWAILLLFKGKFEYPRLGYSFYFLVILFMIWSWIGVFYPYKSILETVIFIVKNAEWIVLFFVFYNYRSFFSISYEKAIKLYIYFSVALFFITLVGLFIPNPIIGKDIISENNENFPDYANRFSLGQPAVASFSQLVSAIYLLTRRTKSIVQVICMLVCMSGVLLSTSTTGILVLVCILILYGGYGVMLAPSRTKIKITVGLISLVAIIYYIVNSTWFIENFGLGYLLLSTKIDAFFGGNSYDPSMAVRDAQQENVLRILGMTPFGYLLGQGVSGLFVENTYYALLLRYGVVGVLAYVFFNMKLLIMIRKVKNKIFYLAFVLIYLGHAYTLDIFPTTPMLAYAFPFIIIYIINCQNPIEKEK